jgi:uncharacterized membrane protein YvbJ
LDRTIAMTEQVLGIGLSSQAQMQTQSDKLKKTGRNLKQIEKKAVPGLDKMLGLIKRVELRNKLIIAFVIALCIVILIFLSFQTAPSSPALELSPGQGQILPPKAALKQ